MPMKCLTFLELYKYPVSSLYFNGTKLSCRCFHFDVNSVASHSACTLLTNTPHLVKKKQQRQQLTLTKFRAFLSKKQNPHVILEKHSFRVFGKLIIQKLVKLR